MLLAAAENTGKFWLVIVAVIFAAISAYYYFRVIQAMYFKEPGEPVIDHADVSRPFKIVLAFCAVLIIILGIYPEFLLGWIYH